MYHFRVEERKRNQSKREAICVHKLMAAIFPEDEEYHEWKVDRIEREIKKASRTRREA
jgi:hypothetical protein